MYIPYKIIGIPVKPVVVVVPALIGAEFLIGSSVDRFSTVETFLFHSTKVLIKIQKNVFKQIQTTINDCLPHISDYFPRHLAGRV